MCHLPAYCKLNRVESRKTMPVWEALGWQIGEQDCPQAYRLEDKKGWKSCSPSEWGLSGLWEQKLCSADSALSECQPLQNADELQGPQKYHPGRDSGRRRNASSYCQDPAIRYLIILLPSSAKVIEPSSRRRMIIKADSLEFCVPKANLSRSGTAVNASTMLLTLCWPSMTATCWIYSWWQLNKVLNAALLGTEMCRISLKFLFMTRWLLHGSMTTGQWVERFYISGAFMQVQKCIAFRTVHSRHGQALWAEGSKMMPWKHRAARCCPERNLIWTMCSTQSH